MAESKKPVDSELPSPNKPSSEKDATELRTRAAEIEADEISFLRSRLSSLEGEVSRLRGSRSSADERYVSDYRYDDRERRDTGRRDERESTRSYSLRASRSEDDRPDDRSGRRARSDREGSRSRDDRDERPSEKRVSDSFRDLSDRAIDEVNKMARGVTLAYIEQLRTAADAVTTFVDEVNDRNRPEDRDSVRDLVTKLPGDVYSGFVNALDRSLDAPRNVINKYHDTYREADDLDEGDDRSSRSRDSRSDDSRYEFRYERDREDRGGRYDDRYARDSQDRRGGRDEEDEDSGKSKRTEVSFVSKSDDR